jgi:hypothetical protein
LDSAEHLVFESPYRSFSYSLRWVCRWNELLVSFPGLGRVVNALTPFSARLLPNTLDSQRMLLRVEQGKGKKDRYAVLSPRAAPSRKPAAAPPSRAASPSACLPSKLQPVDRKP